MFQKLAGSLFSGPAISGRALLSGPVDATAADLESACGSTAVRARRSGVAQCRHAGRAAPARHSERPPGEGHGDTVGRRRAPACLTV